MKKVIIKVNCNLPADEMKALAKKVSDFIKDNESRALFLSPICDICEVNEDDVILFESDVKEEAENEKV